MNKCIDCVNRLPGCHDSCKDYQAFKQECDGLRKKHKKYMDSFNFENRLKKVYGKGW